MHCYYYKMQSKKILLHVQSILELIITFHTCFFSLFSLSPSSGSLQLIEGVSVDGNQLYKIIRIIIAVTVLTSSVYQDQAQSSLVSILATQLVPHLFHLHRWNQISKRDGKIVI